MKKLLICVLITVVAVSSFGGDKKDRTDPVAEKLEEIISENSDTVINDLTLGEINALMAEISVPIQEAAYVSHARSMSYMMPGAGQFMTGDKVSGALFFAADLLVKAGTLTGVYFLLPPELQFGSLDYFNAPHSEIKAAWESAAESASFMDALPTLGVMTGGMLLHKVLGVLSAKNAASRARQNIEDGTVVFEPRTSFFSSKHGMFGVGMGMRF